MKREVGFTLTELLVIVVIIGVLSAVVLPKFNKMLESRKTTEAEHIMTAVRSEQEARCTLDRDYATTTADLKSWPKNENKNFDFNVTGGGIKATNKAVGYVLQMPSYRDGRICCASGCDKLNKNYPLCSDLTKTPDYQVADTGCTPGALGGQTNPVELTTPTPGPTPNPTPACVVPPSTTKTQLCGCNNEGTRTLTFNSDPAVCDWEEGPCSAKETDCETSACDEIKPLTHRRCKVKGKNCGEQERGAWCNEMTQYQWIFGKWSTCTPTEACSEEEVDCDISQKPAEVRACSCGEQVRQVECMKIEGKAFWIAYSWSDCQGDNCGNCSGTPLEDRECTPGSSKYDGTNICSVMVQNLQERTTDGGNIEESQNFEDVHPGLDGGNIGKESYSTPKVKMEDRDLGYLCDERCKWKRNECPYRGGGGGGGGHPQTYIQVDDFEWGDLVVETDCNWGLTEGQFWHFVHEVANGLTGPCIGGCTIKCPN